jgi:hypothetical protein
MAAQVHVSLVEFTNQDVYAQPNAVPSGTMIGTAEVMTTDGSSNAATLTADTATLAGRDPRRVAWRIAVVGGAVGDLVYAAFGSTPTASATTGFLCPNLTVNYFGVDAVGEDCATIGPA